MTLNVNSRALAAILPSVGTATFPIPENGLLAGAT